MSATPTHSAAHGMTASMLRSWIGLVPKFQQGFKKLPLSDLFWMFRTLFQIDQFSSP